MRVRALQFGCHATAGPSTPESLRNHLSITPTTTNIAVKASAGDHDYAPATPSVKLSLQRAIAFCNTRSADLVTGLLAHIPRNKSTTVDKPFPTYNPTIVAEEESMAYTKSIGSSTSSTKRKRGSETWFYAVTKGKVPGIYQSWPEAEKAKGDSKASFCKKFPTLKEAEVFMGGTSNLAAKSGKTKYYGVAVGNTPGVYTDWKDVQIQIKGCKGADQQKFLTFDEAKAYVTSGGRNSSTPIRGDRSETSSLATGKMDKSVEPPPKRQKKENAPPTTLTNGDIKFEPGMGLLPPDAVDGFDRNIKLDPDSGNIRFKTEEESGAIKQQPTGDFSGPIVVYTDGSSLGNGKVGAVAGVGVYFGPNDPSRNVSEPLRGERQTNQRAELVAIARALDHIPIDRNAEIITDSNYSIQCLKKWNTNWEDKAKKGEWFNSAGKSVENQDLIKPILARIRERESCGVETKLTWIKGHNNDPGNVAADALAVAGSRSSTPATRKGDHHDISETLRTMYRSPKELQAEQALDRDGDEFEEIFANLKAENADNLDVAPEALAASNEELDPQQAYEHWRSVNDGSLLEE